MSEKLPDGWSTDQQRLWTGDGGAYAAIGTEVRDFHFYVVVKAPRRATLAEAERDRLNMIAGLEGRHPDISAVEAERDFERLRAIKAIAERDAAHTKIERLNARLDHYVERIDRIVEALDAVRAPQCGGAVDRIRALASRHPSELLRDSMRVTQEENARLKAEQARLRAEIEILRQRVAGAEGYAQHLLAALNAASGLKGLP